jgi:hypothetical protein
MKWPRLGFESDLVEARRTRRSQQHGKVPNEAKSSSICLDFIFFAVQTKPKEAIQRWRRQACRVPGRLLRQMSRDNANFARKKDHKAA